MAKAKQLFFCKECGHESAKWLGNCPACQAWNSFVEAPSEISNSDKKSRFSRNSPAIKPLKLDEISEEETSRLTTGMDEFDRVLGGGLVPGSLILLGGDPGIGKSTLTLQIIRQNPNLEILYCSGEESAAQIKQRAARLRIKSGNIRFITETDLNRVVSIAEKEAPSVLIIDSIQTLYQPEANGTPGSPSQLRESTLALLQLAKGKNICTICIGHVTKEGELAGPRMLEHMVDTVLQFEGDDMHQFRLLRSLKNRFGRTNEIGMFEMTELGLMEKSDPSEFFLSELSDGISGTAVTCSLEGSRPILLEVQALVTQSYYGVPQRTSNGFDTKRLQLLLAVLEKRCNLNLGDKDVFVNVAGGMKLREPASDLAVVTAVLSSYYDIPVKEKSAFIGEVGLNAELRSVLRMEDRVREAEKMGFDKVFGPQNKASFKGIALKYVTIGSIQKLVDALRK